MIKLNQTLSTAAQKGTDQSFSVSKEPRARNSIRARSIVDYILYSLSRELAAKFSSIESFRDRYAN